MDETPTRVEAEAAQVQAWKAFHKHTSHCGTCEVVRRVMVDLHGPGLTTAAKDLDLHIRNCCAAGQEYLHEWAFRRQIHWDLLADRVLAA